MSDAAFTDPALTWNERFATADYHFGEEPNAYLRENLVHLPPAGRVLCVADGEGRNSVWLAGRGFAVDAFDIAERGVAKARALALRHGVTVHFEVASADDWHWPVDAYDAVAAIFVQFADPAMRARLFDHMIRALKPGGILILQGYTPKQLEFKTGGPPEVSHLYTAELLREAFASLEILELREYEGDLAEGTRHRGRSAVIGMVARKP